MVQICIHQTLLSRLLGICRSQVVGLAKRNPTTKAFIVGLRYRFYARRVNSTYIFSIMQYRRAFVSGGCFFFTLVTERRRKLFMDNATVDLLRQSLRHVMTKRPFTIDAVVVLSDHLHCIWTLPPGDYDFSTRWRLIKTHFTKHFDQRAAYQPNNSRLAKRQGHKMRRL